jgi:hypothetical protein
VDGGFGYYGETPPVQTYPTNSGTGQQWVWNGSLLSNVLVASGGGVLTGPYMADNGDGTLTENAIGDAWTVTNTGNGYTVRNNRTGRYLSIVSDVLAMSSTQTVWTISALSSPPPSPPPPPAPLSNGTYIISSGSNSVDGGFGYYGETPPVQTYPTNSGTGQQWVWNGSLLSNVLVASGGGVLTGPYMADNGDGTVTENATGDAWTVTNTGNGYTVRNNRTGRYLSIVSNDLAMSSLQTAWTISALPSPSPMAITLAPASATIPDNAPAGTLIAAATVTMSDGSEFAGTLTTSDTTFFAISGLNIVTARASTSADQGTHSTVITASQGSQSFSMGFSL